ncbi:cytochrome P450 84A1 [Manihot esculenta]|uniref:Uncharacterized protein n=1 Tax=Manihot esculenta TaxID=3983 RepID=A0A2C9W0V3_MANES|nr:cytochrome P450 84A1 [Manihot esculenta]OAY52447.1 hypothetical protein MANES_04G084300v8 [Manihot esculenta]
MDSLQSPTTLLYLLPLLVAFMIFLLHSRRKLPYPPGPRGYPIIGNMGIMDQLTHRGLASLAKRYGGIFHLQMGTVHFMVVSTPELAQEILQEQDSAFCNRPANVAMTYLSYNRADMAFANYGPVWRQLRKICVMKLFSRKRAESWASVREEVDSMIRALMEKTASQVNIGELVFALTRNITYRAAFGSFSHEGQDEFIKIMQEFSILFGAFDIADFFPWLGWIHAQENKRLVRARQSLDRFIDTIIDEHMEKKKRDKHHSKDENGVEIEEDMVDELMAFYRPEDDKNGFYDSQSTIKLTRDNIKAIIMDVMFGGTETVASPIEWAMAELMRNPEGLNKVQQELTEVVGLNRVVHESDLENLSYLKCVVKETLRLHPPVPLLRHETLKDSVLSGYRIPAKSRILINAWLIGRDPYLWHEPEMFDPSRFLKDGAPDFKGSNFEFLPFGSGRRSCPGMQLGLYAVEMSLAHLLHCFKWELPNGMKASEVDMSEAFGLTAPRAERLVAVPTYRLNCPL